jgi:tRNA dimethylallyltransferase
VPLETLFFLPQSLRVPSSLPRLIAIVGPTASGKTALAVEIARAVGGEVVSCDSRQVYRDLDLGTGKATRAEMRGVPHHLLDVASPSRPYSVAKYKRDALRAIRGILRRGKVPILCGGTGLYADAVVYGQTFPAVPQNPGLRRELAALSTEAMAARLAATDPERAAAIDPRNRHRLERAIEIAEALGAVPKLPPRTPRFDALWIGVAPEKGELHARIGARLDARLRRGMIAEAKRLRAGGLSWRRFETLGLEYRWLGRFLRGEISRQTMRDSLLAEIRRYAKRQMTWFRRNKKIAWHHPSKADKAVALAKDFLARR